MAKNSIDFQQFTDDENSDNDQTTVDFNEYIRSGLHRSSPHSDLSAITISSTDSQASDNDETKFKFSYSRLFGKGKRKNPTTSIWSVEYNPYQKLNEPNLFAVAIGPHCYVYESTSTGKIELFTGFEDPDPTEDFYTCCWSVSAATSKLLVLAAGERGIIRILHLEDSNIESTKTLIGHSGAVNQLKVSRQQKFLLASASRDRSIRLWNIENGICIATFHALNSHRDDVVTIDFNMRSTKLVSGGTDHILAIWDLTHRDIVAAIENSQLYSTGNTKHFKTLFHPFPVFTTSSIHCNYIDCVQWFGDFIFSKSNGDDLICWQQGMLPCDTAALKKLPRDAYTKIAVLDVNECKYYFMRFAINHTQTTLALGNSYGEVRVYDLEASDPRRVPFYCLKHPKYNVTIRDVSFSRCGRDLIVCCDFGIMCLYQRKPKSTRS